MRGKLAVSAAIAALAGVCVLLLVRAGRLSPEPPRGSHAAVQRGATAGLELREPGSPPLDPPGGSLAPSAADAIFARESAGRALPESSAPPTHLGAEREAIPRAAAGTADAVPYAGAVPDAEALAGPTISGFVVDETGTPASGVSLLAVPLDPAASHSSVSAQSLEDGSFSLRVSIEGAHRVRASAPGYAGVDVEVVARQAEEASILIELVEERRAGGRVVDAVLAPVAGALVSGRQSEEWISSATTDVDGRFELAGLGPDRVRVRVTHDGFLPWEEEVDAGGAPLVVALEPGQRFRGLVIDEASREPIAGAEIRATAAEARDERPAPRCAILADARGSFDLTIDDRPWRLAIRAPGYVEERFTVTARGFQVPKVEYFSLRRGAVCTGRLLDPDGAPVPRLVVRLDATANEGEARPGPSAESDADGRVRFDALAPGRYRVTASHTRFLPLDAWLEIGSTAEEITWRLDRGAAISGLVLRATGERVTRGYILIEQKDERWQVGLDAAGRFVSPPLRGGNYRVSYRASTRSAPHSLEVSVARGSEREIDIVLESPQG